MKRFIDQERPDRLTIKGHLRGIPLSGKSEDAFPSGHALHVGGLASAATLLPAKFRNVVRAAGAVLVTTRVDFAGALVNRRRSGPRTWLDDRTGNPAPDQALRAALIRETQRGAWCDWDQGPSVTVEGVSCRARMHLWRCICPVCR